VKFTSWMVFVPIWVTLSYFPLAHMVWGGGFLSGEPGALATWFFDDVAPVDYAGGTVVHINAGMAALVLALVIGVRRGFGKEVMRPHNLPFTMLGAGLLWFGWFGFNAGSAVAADHPVAGPIAGLAFATTQSAAAAATLTWMLIEWLHTGKPTSLGMASGIVAGLVAITPAAGHVTPLSALAIGAVASLVCYGAVRLKHRTRVDDSLDAFGVHGVGGMWGALATGIFCFTPVAGLIAGSPAQLGKQAVGVLATIVFAALGTWVLGTLIARTVGLRASDAQERDGLDIAVHGERGYHL